MPHYINVYSYPDSMPVDISFAFENEMPAGKHGFCQVDGENLRFEDGTLAKFWGVIFNGACCFPTHEYAEKVSERLAQAGCNMVRFHQLDSEWATPNIYRLTAGKRLTTTRELSEKSLERMDYLIKCLKEKGIYIAVDMQTWRKYKSGDGVKFANLLGDNSKIYSIFDRTMIDLQKEHAEKFWNHYNPYTGLTYKDEPAFVFCDIINENDMFNVPKWRKDYNQVPYYDNMFRDLFAEWLKENKIEYDAYGCDLYTKDEPMMLFRIHLQKKYAREMYDHIRSLGVKIPLACTNWAQGPGLVKGQEEMDIQDGHCYYYDWGWGEYEKVTGNKGITDIAEAPLANSCATRIHGQPFVMTEWDMPWPNSYRAEGPIWFPAVAALQNWSCMTIHTYAYGTNLSKDDLLGKEASSSTIGGVPYREGIFTSWNDPAKFGLFYHGAMMFRRGDVKPANKTIGARISQYSKRVKTLPGSAMEVHQVHAVLDTTDVSDLEDVRPIEEKFEREDKSMIVSDTGELWRNLKRKFGAVDTERTKAVYGTLGRRSANSRRPDMTITLNGMTVDSETDFGVVAVSSLTDDPICKSDNMLLSAIGRARNAGTMFDGEKLIDYGHGPIQAEVIHADIAIQTEKENLRVWGVNSEGYYVGRVPVTYEDGWLKFKIGPNFPALYYLIMEE